MATRYYHGFPGGTVVMSTSRKPVSAGPGTKPLDPRLDLQNHSPSGFSWGYGGSGPAQLALAILADFLNDDQRALALYQHFKFILISRLDRDASWTLDSNRIERLVAAFEGRP